MYLYLWNDCPTTLKIFLQTATKFILWRFLLYHNLWFVIHKRPSSQVHIWSLVLWWYWSTNLLIISITTGDVYLTDSAAMLNRKEASTPHATSTQVPFVQFQVLRHGLGALERSQWCNWLGLPVSTWSPAVVLMFLQLKAPYDQPGKKVLFSLILYFSGFIFSCCLIVVGAKVSLSSGQIGECENQSYFCCHGTGDA